MLRNRHPARAWQARSTLNAILERHGLLHKNRRRRKWTHPGAVSYLVNFIPRERKSDPIHVAEGRVVLNY